MVVSIFGSRTSVSFLPRLPDLLRGNRLPAGAILVNQRLRLFFDMTCNPKPVMSANSEQPPWPITSASAAAHNACCCRLRNGPISCHLLRISDWFDMTPRLRASRSVSEFGRVSSFSSRAVDQDRGCCDLDPGQHSPAQFLSGRRSLALKTAG